MENEAKTLEEILQMLSEGTASDAAIALWKGAEEIRRNAVLDAHGLPRVCGALDALVAAAIGSGYSVPEKFEDGTLSVRIGHNASHSWEVTYEWHGEAGFLPILTSTDDEGCENNRIVREDEDVPGYVGHY